MTDFKPGHVDVDTSIEREEEMVSSGEWSTIVEVVMAILARVGPRGITRTELMNWPDSLPARLRQQSSASGVLSKMKTQGLLVQLKKRERDDKERPYVLQQFINNRPFDAAKISVPHSRISDDEFERATRFASGSDAAEDVAVGRSLVNKMIQRRVATEE